MIKVGFIVNPYAGMGGAVGLKGTDGCVREAYARGAVPMAPAKAIRFLSSLSKNDIHFLTAGREMGEHELAKVGIPYDVIYRPDEGKKSDPIQTGAIDTINACMEMIQNDTGLIIFCGGDGTARDIFSCTGQLIPILGIPAGVKIYSGVFATTPESGAHLLSDWNGTSLSDGEVMDVDEEEYRKGILNTSLFGYAKIPSGPVRCQSSKQVSFGDESREVEQIATFITEVMRDDTLYLLGAGTTTKAIADRLHLSKTILGIDAVYQGRVIGTDISEREILTLVEKFDRIKIIVSPIGAQGFILGRGNQQISCSVIRKTGVDSLIVVATEAKLRNTKTLFIDTGDPSLNNKFGDTIQVICGYRMVIRAELSH